MTLLDYVKDLNGKYQANIMLDPELAALQIIVPKVTAPWTSILRTVLAQNRLGMICSGGGLVRIAKRENLPAVRRRRTPRPGR